jgi:hypothetical protein
MTSGDAHHPSHEQACKPQMQSGCRHEVPGPRDAQHLLGGRSRDPAPVSEQRRDQEVGARPPDPRDPGGQPRAPAGDDSRWVGRPLEAGHGPDAAARALPEALGVPRAGLGGVHRRESRLEGHAHPVGGLGRARRPAQGHERAATPEAGGARTSGGPRGDPAARDGLGPLLQPHGHQQSAQPARRVLDHHPAPLGGGRGGQGRRVRAPSAPVHPAERQPRGASREHQARQGRRADPSPQAAGDRGPRASDGDRAPDLPRPRARGVHRPRQRLRERGPAPQAGGAPCETGNRRACRMRVRHLISAPSRGP